MDLPEFIDTYSDDLLYLIEARKALLTHPFRTEIKELCDPSFCRLLIVVMVGSIEAMMQHWRDKKGALILDNYFAEGASNGERIRSLYDAFSKAGINVDKEVFNDYLAVKYLRNVIVHARWKPHEKGWVKQRGFPIDTRKFTEDHWHRILEVNRNIMMYIALTDAELAKRMSRDEVAKIKKVEREKLEPMIITRKQFPYFMFRNLENIASKIYEALEKVAVSEKYNWSKDYDLEELKRLPWVEAKKIFFLALGKASKDGSEDIRKLKELMEEAFYFWCLFKQLTFAQKDIELAEMERALRILMDLHERKCYLPLPMPFPWREEVPHQVKITLVKTIGKEKYEGLSETEIAKSLDLGETVYRFIPNITPVSLFAIYFPIINPKDAQAQADEVKFILAAWKLRDSWYMYIERHEYPQVSDWLFYEELFNELLRQVNEDEPE